MLGAHAAGVPFNGHHGDGLWRRADQHATAFLGPSFGHHGAFCPRHPAVHLAVMVIAGAVMLGFLAFGLWHPTSTSAAPRR